MEIVTRARPAHRWFGAAGALLALSAALSIALGPFVETARAAEAVRYEVSAHVALGAGRVRELVTIEVRVGEGEREVRLWLYPERLSAPPSAMEERSARWIYPGEIDRGGMVIETVEVDGQPVRARRVPLGPVGALRGLDTGGADLVVPLAPGPARRVVLRVTATLEVPDRFGRLGRAAGRLFLAAPWYPLVLDGERWTSQVPHVVRIDTDDGTIWAGGDRLGAEREVTAEGSYVPVLIGMPLRVRRAWIDAGHELVLVEPTDGYVPPPRDGAGEAGLEDLTGIDRLGLLRDAARDVVGTAAWLEIPVPEQLVVVVVPSRTELAAAAPGAVLVSDRVFQIIPLEDLRETHRRAVRRAMFQRLAQSISLVDPPADRPWAEDLRAVALQDLDEVRRHHGTQRVDQLLQPFSFHPAVDQLLYAPQVAFEDVYFGAIDEPDLFRDDPARARLPVVRGHRLLESISDVLGPDRIRRFVAMLVRGRRPVRAALERAMPGASVRLPTWLAFPTFEVNYRLGVITSERTERGWSHRVEVIRDGDRRVEPVEVEVEDEHGERSVGRWDGEGDRGVVVIETRGSQRRVTIDPRQRLPQSARVAEGHPRADDATSQPWRLPMFNNFSFDLLLSEGNFTGLADISLRQRYDLEHTLILRISRTVARTTGRIRYLQGLGPKVHNNRRSVLLGGSLAFSRVEPNFGGVGVPGGWALELEGMAILNTQRFIADPRDGVFALVQLAGGGTLADDGRLWGTARGAFRVSGVIPVGLLNAFFLLGAGGFTVGAALDADRQLLGGRYGLRGFANDELVGNGMLYAVAEHRYTMIGDLAVNVLHGVWAREVQLATWVGGGAVFDTPRGEMARLAAEVGTGLRFHYEYGGVQPGVLALDLGVPLSRLIERSQRGEAPGAPVAFYVSFDQYY
ncbi:MAG: hypothetical protein OHK0013_13700 [Sandaracinaceae bacterium]